ncbi:MAG TPA: hypothetical protein VLE73_05375 [Candidatus Saccharimonadales bacterium]|nr:hypothetical protein [Candidatus Saccharimonadales bacterium]
MPLFQKQAAHTLSLYDFWAQHNEHRILFPSLLMYSLAYLTHWNIIVELFVNVLLAGCALLLILDIIRRTVAGRTLKVLVSILAACLFFSPMQWENWLWGWQIEWYLNLLGVIAAVWALCYWPGRWPARLRLPLAIAAATIATYSLGSGPLIWFVGLGILLLRRTPLRQLLSWAVCGVFVLFTYYYHYNSNAGEPSKTLLFREPFKFAGYLMGYLGHPLGWNWLAAACFGIALCIGTAWVGWRYYRQGLPVSGNLGWLGIGSYAFACAVTTDLSRLGFGVTQSFSSRYFTLSMLFTLSVAVLAIQTLHKQRRFALIGLGVLVAIIAGNYIPGVRALTVYGNHIAQEQQCTRHAQPTVACLTDTYPDPKTTLNRLTFLKARHWSGY